MNYITTYNSPLGIIILACNNENLTGLWFSGQKHFPDVSKAIKKETCIHKKVKLWLDKYFKGTNPQINNIKLAPHGTEFQQKIWEILTKIPYGKTTTYGDIAKQYSIKTGKKTSPRAVGTAIGKNPISIIIPCHRVIGKNGSLTGYAGGIDRKTQLLKLEELSQ